MKKVKKYIIPVLVLSLFVVIMNSGEFLKNPFNKKEDVEGFIKAVKRDVYGGNWKNAESDLEQLKAAWKSIEKRVQFSVERSEMNMIDTSIARIEGALSAHDKESAIVELSEVRNHWEELEE